MQGLLIICLTATSAIASWVAFSYQCSQCTRACWGSKDQRSAVAGPLMRRLPRRRELGWASCWDRAASTMLRRRKRARRPYWCHSWWCTPNHCREPHSKCPTPVCGQKISNEGRQVWGAKMLVTVDLGKPQPVAQNKDNLRKQINTTALVGPNRAAISFQHPAIRRSADGNHLAR
jgi:hypothetical protein